MTAAIQDEDIYAFRPAPVKAALVKPTRRVWPWVLGGLLLLALLIAACGAALLLNLIDIASHGTSITVNGDSWSDWDSDWLEGSHGWWAALAVVGGLLLAALVVMIVVPLALLLAAMGIALGVGTAVLAVAAVAALVLSPLWGFALLLWLLLRKRPAPVPTGRMGT